MPSLTVNGRPLDFRMDPETPLLWALRDGANLTGSKYGCGVGDCGACMVLVDGAAQASCRLSLAEAEGRFVTTIEGLNSPLAHAVRAALLAEGAVQCGFCTPGIVVSVVALLSANAAPSEAAIKAGVANLCRCGVYPRLLRAVRRAAAALPQPLARAATPVLANIPIDPIPTEPTR